MAQDPSKELIAEYAARPSQKHWEWIRDIITQAPAASQPALIDAAQAALKDWPAQYLNGSGRRDDRILSIHDRWARELKPESPLWPLVRSLTVESTPTLPPQPLDELSLGAFNDTAAAVETLRGWEHFAALRALRFERWDDETPGLMRGLVDGLTPATVSGLHLLDVSATATAEVGDALLATSWPARTELSVAPRRLGADRFEKVLRSLGGQLRRLRLTGQLTTEAAELIAECCPKLEALDAPFDAGALVALSGRPTPSLSTLQARYGSELSAEDWRALADWPASLRTLDIYYQKLGDDGLVALAGSNHLGALEVLRLRACHLEKRGLEAWAARPPAALEELDLLANDELDREAIVALCESPAAARLESLSLQANKLTDADTVRLASAKTLSGLRTLVLHGAKLNKKLLGRLLQSPAVQGLEHLDLSDPKGRGLKDVDAFVSAPALERLRSLTLSGHQLSFALGALETLATSPHLKQLEEVCLTNNGSEAPLAATELPELRKAGLPRLREVVSGGD